MLQGRGMGALYVSWGRGRGDGYWHRLDACAGHKSTASWTIGLRVVRDREREEEGVDLGSREVRCGACEPAREEVEASA